MTNYKEDQKRLCKKYGATFFDTPISLRIAVSKNIFSNLVPVNGLRHPPEGNMSGWYVWSGEGTFKEDPNFFEPVCIDHIPELKPEIVKYLGLPPGWRFLIAGHYEDVWFDENLLNS